MTEEEVRSKLKTENEQYITRQEFIRKNHEIKVQTILDTYAQEVARFKIGDILSSNDNIIRVTRFSGNFSKYANSFYITYHGVLLTKKLKPRKDCSEFDIYDDGREIIKIEE